MDIKKLMRNTLIYKLYSLNFNFNCIAYILYVYKLYS